MNHRSIGIILAAYAGLAYACGTSPGTQQSHSASSSSSSSDSSTTVSASSSSTSGVGGGSGGGIASSTVSSSGSSVSSSSGGGVGGMGGAGGSDVGGSSVMSSSASSSSSGGVGGGGGCNAPNPVCYGPGTLQITHDLIEFEPTIKYYDLQPDPNSTVACSSVGTDPCQKVIYIEAAPYDIPVNVHVDFIPEGESVPNPACHFEGIFLYHFFQNQIPGIRVEKAPQLTQAPSVIPTFMLNPPPNLICGNYPMLSIKMGPSSCGQPHIIQQTFP